MLWVLLLLAIVLVAVAVLASLKGKRPGGNGDDYPYKQRIALFTPAERSFLGVLDQAVGEQYRIFGKVRVADVIQPRKGLDNSRHQTALNRIQSKHFDFLLCARSDLSILCAIELDDKSHGTPERKKRDHFLENACRASDLPLLQLPAQHGYTVRDLRSRIYDSLESVTVKTAKPQPREAANGPTVVSFPSDPEFGAIAGSSVSAASVSEPQFDVRPLGPVPTVPTTATAPRKQTRRAAAPPSCPKCGAPMLRRRVKSGSRAGLVFWGCSTYPKCRGALREGSGQAPSSAADTDG